MKKNLIYSYFLLLILVLGFLKLTKIQTLAGGYDYYPSGQNYIDTTNHKIETTNNIEYRFVTINPFKIKGEFEYSLFVTFNKFDQILEYEFTFYNIWGEIIELETSYSEIRDEDDRIIGINFVSPKYSSRIKLNVLFKNDINMPANYKEELDYIFVFCEGFDYPALNLTSVPYMGYLETETVEEGEVGFLKTNVDNPITVEEIIASITVIDDFDGDVSDSIIIESNQYSSNSDTLGIYEIILRANDKSNNYSYFKIYIEVEDLTPPDISGKDYYLEFNSKQLDLDEIMANLIISDNYDAYEDLYIEVISNNYSNNFEIVGLYEVIYKVVDLSGNESIKTVVIKVEDNIPPIITGPSTFKKYDNMYIDIYSYIDNYSAFDETDGDITEYIVIIKDEYTEYYNKAGLYEIILSCSDLSGNESEISFIIEVIDNIGPIFIINKALIKIELTKEVISANKIIEVIQEMNEINFSVIEILEDNYSENSDIPGLYNIKLLSGNSTYNIEIEVTETSVLEEIVEIKKPGSFFKKLYQALVDFYRYLFF